MTNQSGSPKETDDGMLSKSNSQLKKEKPAGAWKRVIIWLANLGVKKDEIYLITKALLRVEVLILVFGFIFYLVSGYLTWKIKPDETAKIIYLTDSILNKSTELNANNLDVVNRNFDSIIRKQHFIPFSISNFYREKGNDNALPGTAAAKKNVIFTLNPLYKINPDTLAQLSALESYSRAKLATAIKNIVNKAGSDNYNNYGLDQFLVSSCYASNNNNTILIYLLIIFLLLILTYGYNYYLTIVRENEYQKEQSQLHEDAQKGAEALLVWDLAQKKLNKYYDRNLNQNNSIFIVSVVVMIAGFAMVLFGISLYFKNPQDHGFITTISAVSGTIVQFIGATFLVIYNTTIKQAIQYTNSLQKTSTIGTSIKILDNIHNNETDASFQVNQERILLARIDIAKMLINSTTIPDPPAEPKGKK